MPKKVEKLWGHEEWIENNEKYCMKVLVFQPGFQSSLHYHPIKHETMLVVSGECEMEVEGKVERLEAGQGHIIPPGTKHRFKAVNGPCIVVEASTHHEDSDCIRIEDSRRIE